MTGRDLEDGVGDVIFLVSLTMCCCIVRTAHLSRNIVNLLPIAPSSSLALNVCIRANPAQFQTRLL